MPRSSNREHVHVPHTGFGFGFGLVDGSKKDMNDRHATQSWLGLGFPYEQAEALGWSAAHTFGPCLGQRLPAGLHRQQGHPGHGAGHRLRGAHAALTPTLTLPPTPIITLTPTIILTVNPGADLHRPNLHPHAKPNHHPTPNQNNHLRFIVKYHKSDTFSGARIVGFEVEAYSVKHTYEGECRRMLRTQCPPGRASLRHCYLVITPPGRAPARRPSLRGRCASARACSAHDAGATESLRLPAATATPPLGRWPRESA